MLVSVVIPTFNRSALLRESISLLMGQVVDENTSYEVIFVNNGSDDDTESILRDAAAAYPDKLRYFTIAPSGGPAAPRNAGIRAAKGLVAIILDDDVLPDKDLVQKHADYHRLYPDNQSAAVGVAYVPASMKTRPISLFHEFDYAPLESCDTVSYVYFWTCNLSIKRKFMLQHGMFDERFLYNEDLVCARRLAAAGMQLRFLPSARGAHVHQLELDGVPMKGRFVGRWIWATTQEFNDTAMLERYGVLSPRLGPLSFMRRLLNRAALRSLDTGIARWVLVKLGALSGERSHMSDLYYYVIYRRAILNGYAEARRAAAIARRAGRRLDPCNLVRSLPW